MTDRRYRRHPAAIWRATARFLVVAVPPSPPTRVVGSAGAVWHALDTPKRVSDVVTELGEMTTSDHGEVARDVLALLEELVALGLVEVVR